tara:strand:- start:22 stop:1278 length:1257 start_codon:yes stop_codon:yes gene_type:complete
MGGNAKHMPHIWENYDATFGEVINLLEGLTTGAVDVTEKFDGANIHFRVDRSGTVRFSRNGEQVASGGFTFEEALSLYQNHHVRDLFVEGCRAIDEMFTGKWWPFGYSGRDWLNTEIIFTENPQLLNYGNNAIVLHEVVTFIPGGKCRDSAKQKKINRFLESVPAQTTTVTNRLWKALGPCPVMLSDEAGFGYFSEAQSRLQKCMSYAGLTEKNTLRDFLRVSLRNGPIDEIRTSKSVKDMLADKISGINPAVRLVDLKRNQPAGVAKEISYYGQRKNEARHCKAAMKPIINTLDAFSANRLSNLTSVLITDATAEQQRIMSEIDFESERILLHEDEHIEQRKEMFNSLLEEWNNITTKPAAIEGLTFEFCGGRTKITGGFATLNQLLGLNRYGRGTIPALQEEEKQVQSLVEYFGLL